MIRITDKADCCGCTACASICPKDAITMEPDVMGFLYPKVDTGMCIDCGLCERVCSFNDDYDKSQNLPEPIAYGGRHKKMYEVETSRSGAAFIAISDWILDQGGVIYGAGYIDHFRVVHKRATTKEERNEFKGSKYVQSDVNTTFRQVKRDLKNGMTVLFSGTPCQTSGLASYVGKNLRENLYLVDIVCHGVPGPYIWRDYLAYLEKKQRNEITEVNFRNKEKFGWKAHRESFMYRGDAYIYTYSYTFYNQIMFRHSCGKCHFANIHRPSDITIADFWGWEKTSPTFNIDDKGVSLILCNTEKGKEMFEMFKKDMYFFSAKLEDCLQPNIQYPTEIHPLRMNFERDYVEKGFVYVMRKYGNIGWRNKLKKLKDKLSRII